MMALGPIFVDGKSISGRIFEVVDDIILFSHPAPSFLSRTCVCGAESDF
jgi:hypothetical protein